MTNNTDYTRTPADAQIDQAADVTSSRRSRGGKRAQRAKAKPSCGIRKAWMYDGDAGSSVIESFGEFVDHDIQDVEAAFNILRSDLIPDGEHVNDDPCEGVREVYTVTDPELLARSVREWVLAEQWNREDWEQMEHSDRDRIVRFLAQYGVEDPSDSSEPTA